MKKKVKYNYIVDLIDVETPADLMARFADAKQRANLPLTDAEFNGVINRTVEIVPSVITVINCDCYRTKKKLPWYKRMWNKLRGKK